MTTPDTAPPLDIRRIAEEIVAREGGYVNDPDDPGGPTKHGVTLGTLKRLGGDVTGDGSVDIADVRALTKPQAVQIYLEHYFRRTNVVDLPDALQPTVFDMYVNSGSTAAVLLQRLLRQMGHDVTVDGAIGPETASAATLATVQAPRHIVDAYGIARRNYYLTLADRRPALRKYARTRAGGKGGWVRRAEEFISPRFHMTDKEFSDRVASWG